MANDNNSWDVDDIDFSEIDFEDLDLDDLDFSVDGELNSINDERPKKKVELPITRNYATLTPESARPIRGFLMGTEERGWLPC